MHPFLKKYGSIIISLVGAVAILATALLTKGTEYNDTGWFYAFCAWLLLYAAFEAYSSLKKKKNDKEV